MIFSSRLRLAKKVEFEEIAFESVQSNEEMFTLYFKANWKMLQLVSSLILLNSYFSLNSKFTSRTVRQFAHRPPKFVPHSTTTDAMQDGSVIDRIPIEILEMLHDNYKGSQGLQILLPQLFSACRLIGTALRDGDFTADKTGTANPFGDQQLDVDIRADKVLQYLFTKY